MTDRCFYVYYDDEGVPFFQEATSDGREPKAPTFDFPVGFKVYDPNTLEEWVPPDNYVVPVEENVKDPVEPVDPVEEPKEEEEEEVLASISVSENLELDVPETVRKFSMPQGSIDSGSQVRILVDSEDVTKFMAEELASKIHQFQIQDYAKRYFREHRTNHVFKRKRIAIDALVSFSTELLNEPLLEALDKECSKLAINCFKFILQYTKVIPCRAPKASAENIVNILRTNPALRDEVYFQLIKQTCHTPSNDILIDGLKLFLIISTIFPSTRNSENWIKVHLVNLSRHHDIYIASMAQFTYIRFSARCAIGTEKKEMEINYVEKIPQQVSMGWQTFGASIYEMMWNQRLKEPKLPIPFIEYYLANILIKLGAYEREGIFRLPGNLTTVDELASNLNDGKDTLAGKPLNDIASLFKKWFRDLPNPVVPVDRLNDIINMFEDGKKDYVQFCETLPRPHKMVLMFLIGFLKDLAQHADVTRMDEKNLAMVFGPNIVKFDNFTDYSSAKFMSSIPIDFLLVLIQNWDTSEIYPIKREMLTCPPPDMV